MTRWLICAIAILGVSADWRQFRGTGGTGSAEGPPPPIELTPERNLQWKAPLVGRGLSSPLVIGDRVIVTASSGPKHDRLHVLAFAKADGKKLWDRTVFATGPTASHPKTCMAAPTPASDGKRVVALFGTNDLICLDLDGNVLWLRSLYEENPGATDGRGLAASPVIANDTVIVASETQNVSFVAGINVFTGANRWRIDRPRDISWTTPILVPRLTSDVPEYVVLQSSPILSAIDPMTGKEIWKIERKNHPISSALYHDDVLFVPGMEGGLGAFRRRPSGAPMLLWESERLNPDTASPVAIGNRIFSLKSSILATGETANGKVIGQLRLRGPFSASPVTAGGLIYCVSEDGRIQVVKPGEGEPKVVGGGALNEPILATPAVADGAIYLRSDRHLWKFGASAH